MPSPAMRLPTGYPACESSVTPATTTIAILSVRAANPTNDREPARFAAQADDAMN